MTPFASAAFRWLWSSSLASAAASGMERTATGWLALSSDGGPLAVGLVLAARMLAPLLFGLPAGTLADRANRSRQLMAVAAGALPLMLGLSWLASGGAVPVLALVGLSFATGCVNVFDAPARQALVLDTVPRAIGPNALALNAVAVRFLFAIGALSAGALIPLVGVAGCYLVVGGAFGLAGVLAAFVQPGRELRERVEVPPPFGRALHAALHLVLDLPAVRVLMGAAVLCEVFAFSYPTVVPVIARDVLQAGAEGLGTLNAAASVGGCVAVVLLSARPGRVRREPLLGLVFVVFGGSLLALAAAGELAAAALVLALTGACGAAFDLLQQTLIQLAVPEGQRGRAVGVWIVGTGSAPIGHLEMGALVAGLGAPTALLVNGSLVLAAAAALLARAPAYRWRTSP